MLFSSPATFLDQALRAQGIPIVGVSIGHAGDKATWRIDFAPEATDAQKTTAAKMMLSFDEAAAAAEPEVARDLVGEIDALKTRLSGLQNLLVKKSVIRADDIAGALDPTVNRKPNP